jgi:hypothetical protein
MKTGATNGYGWGQFGSRWGGCTLGVLLAFASLESVHAGNVSAKISERYSEYSLLRH